MEGVNDVTPTDQDWLVDFRGVELRRGGKTLVGPVDWQVELDERWVIIGPNGAGKASETLVDAEASGVASAIERELAGSRLACTWM